MNYKNITKAERRTLDTIRRIECLRSPKRPVRSLVDGIVAATRRRMQSSSFSKVVMECVEKFDRMCTVEGGAVLAGGEVHSQSYLDEIERQQKAIRDTMGVPPEYLTGELRPEVATALVDGFVVTAACGPQQVIHAPAVDGDTPVVIHTPNMVCLDPNCPLPHGNDALTMGAGPTIAQLGRLDGVALAEAVEDLHGCVIDEASELTADQVAVALKDFKMPPGAIVNSLSTPVMPGKFYVDDTNGMPKADA